MAGGAIHHEFDENAFAVEHACSCGRAVVFDPGLRSAEWMLQAFDVRCPSSDFEIEIMCTVAQRFFIRSAGGESARGESECGESECGGESSDVFHPRSSSVV